MEEEKPKKGTIARSAGIITGKGVKTVGAVAKVAYDGTANLVGKYKVVEAAKFAKNKVYESAGLKEVEDKKEADKLAKAVGVLGTGAVIATYSAGAVAAAIPLAGAAAVAGGVAYFGGKAGHSYAKERAPKTTGALEKSVNAVSKSVKSTASEFATGLYQGTLEPNRTPALPPPPVDLD